MDKKRVILVGGFHEVIELCENCGYEIVGIIDNILTGTYYGYKIIGKDSDAEALYPTYKDCELVITPDSPKIREKLVALYSGYGYKFATVISPEARISKTATIGKGTVIQAGVNVSAETHIGNFVKLNTNCNVMHDNVVGDYVTIAPNAVSLGKIRIGGKAYIGANSTILPNLIIGKGAVVGAGAVVTKNVNDNTVVKGVPSK